MARKKSSFMKRHGLSIVTGAILGLWLILYAVSDEHKHWAPSSAMLSPTGAALW